MGRWSPTTNTQTPARHLACGAHAVLTAFTRASQAHSEQSAVPADGQEARMLRAQGCAGAAMRTSNEDAAAAGTHAYARSTKNRSSH
jgi:hypothetical protein